MWPLFLYEVSDPLPDPPFEQETDICSCAVSRYIKSPKCYACGAPTNGIFNKAERIIAKIEARNQKKREAKGVTEADEEDDDGGIQIGGDSSDEEGENGEEE